MRRSSRPRPSRMFLPGMPTIEALEQLKLLDASQATLANLDIFR